MVGNETYIPFRNLIVAAEPKCTHPIPVQLMHLGEQTSGICAAFLVCFVKMLLDTLGCSFDCLEPIGDPTK